MYKYWICGWLVAAMVLSGCSPAGDDQRAGMAYSENDRGELVPADGMRTTTFTPPPMKRKPRGADVEWLSSFDLIERSGESVTSEQLQGQPYVLSFFFSLCPTICVQQNEKVQMLQEKFAGQPIRLVSITCDPAIDRPEVLAKYAERFEADAKQWLFLTGEMNYIRRVGAEMFSLPVDVRFHAEKFVLVDATGQVHAFYNWTDDLQWQQLQGDMAKMLAAGGTLAAPVSTEGEASASTESEASASTESEASASEDEAHSGESASE